MRIQPVVFLVVACGLLCSCRTADRSRASVDPGPPGQQEIDAAVRELARGGSFQADALLSAAAPAAEREVHALLDSTLPSVRRRAALVLLSGGMDLSLTAEQQVDLALFEIMRTDGQPWSRLSGILRLDGLGERADSWLRAEASGQAERAVVAQRLLHQRVEAK